MRKFRNKIDLINFIKTQLNIELANDTKHHFNQKRNILYTRISGTLYSNPIISLLAKYKIRYEKHLNDYYWIWIK